MTRSPLATPKSCHDGGERLHLMQHLGVGQSGDTACQRRIVDQRRLIAAAGRDVAIQCVVAGVDHGAGEPPAVKPHGGIEDLPGGRDPVDLPGRLAPKTLGIPERARMDLVIPAFSLDVHGAAPAVFDRLSPCMAGHVPAMTRINSQPFFLPTIVTRGSAISRRKRCNAGITQGRRPIAARPPADGPADLASPSADRNPAGRTPRCAGR